MILWIYIYIDIDDQHPDSMRFVHDCEVALGKPIEVIRSSQYSCVADVCHATRYIRSPKFAPCTDWLKKRVRKKWEYEHRDYDVTYIWGFDANEKNRANRLIAAQPDFTHRFPLIENNLSKGQVHGILQRLGIKRPVMYDMGYNNNNCIGCVKGGMGYWNKIRVDFPEVFNERSALEREIGHSVLKECFLDELDPNRGRNKPIEIEDCGIACELKFDS